MNKCVRKSINLANEQDYLDRLHEVYSVSEREERKISENIEGKIKEAYDERDDENLVKTLLELDKFPIDDPYVSLLRGRNNLIEIILKR